ncbi:hypothetical protein [Pseudonocardia xishanensis]|uniref:Uncharacterized protein n=1 Tax=Pseudonocardia xishanensis TaxID=630995 RepID=A0ABP8S2D1_9PSEU
MTTVLGGVLTAAGFATTVRETGEGKLAYLDSPVIDPMQSQVATVLLFFGYLGLTPMLSSFVAMTRTRGRVLGTIAASHLDPRWRRPWAGRARPGRTVRESRRAPAGSRPVVDRRR